MMTMDFDPISASFNELVAQGSKSLIFWRGLFVQIMAEAQNEHDERWRNVLPHIQRLNQAIDTARAIETGQTPPPVTIKAKVAVMGIKGKD